MGKDVLKLFEEIGKALKREGYSREDAIKLADEIKKEKCSKQVTN